MISIFLFAIFCLIFWYLHIQRSEAYKLLKKLPGPKTIPFFGNLFLFNVPVEKQWNVIQNLIDDYYPTCVVWLSFLRPVVSIVHPDDIQILLSSQTNITKGDSYKLLHPWLKTGLLTSAGEKWRHRRKILTPAFHFNILKKYTQIMNENGVKFVENLKTKDKKTIESLIQLCSKHTLNIILDSTMGVSLDKIDKDIGDDYKTAVYQQGNIAAYRAARPYINDWMMNSLWKLGRMHKQSLKIIHDFTAKVISKRREYHKLTENHYLVNITDNEKEPSVTNGVYSRKGLAMLDLLLSVEKQGQIDSEGIAEEVDTFIFEGHDTTAMAMTFTLMLLANNKEIQDKARSEVTKILDRIQGNIELQDLQNFHYLERCIKESLRLYPPVATMLRYLTHDLQLTNYKIPAGTDVIFHAYHIHRNPNFWEEPNKFDPDRFLPERSQGRHPFCYIPFSAGPRNCIGQKFAIMELKCLLSYILYHFKLEPVDNISEMEILLDIVIRPSKPVSVMFIEIEK